MKQWFVLCCGVVSLAALTAPRPREYVYAFKGSYYGIFDPNTRYYFPQKEAISFENLRDTLDLLKQLHRNEGFRKACMRADPSLAALVDSSSIYPALATRYRYEPLMEGKIPEQEPPPLDWFANTVRAKSQNSAFARAVRNRFRSVERLTATVVSELIPTLMGSTPYTIGNLGGAAGDDISVGIARATKGKGTDLVRQFIYDIDGDAMQLGEELASGHYRYEVRGMGHMNIIDLGNLSAISTHLRAENVKWINSIGFFMEYRVEKENGDPMTPEDKRRIFKTYCEGGVERLTFSAYQEHPIPRFVVDVGWKNFELTWTPKLIVSMLKGVGYELKSMDSEALPLMQVYHFKGSCP